MSTSGRLTHGLSSWFFRFAHALVQEFDEGVRLSVAHIARTKTLVRRLLRPLAVHALTITCECPAQALRWTRGSKRLHLETRFQ